MNGTTVHQLNAKFKNWKASPRLAEFFSPRFLSQIASTKRWSPDPRDTDFSVTLQSPSPHSPGLSKHSPPFLTLSHLDSDLWISPLNCPSFAWQKPNVFLNAAAHTHPLPFTLNTSDLCFIFFHSLDYPSLEFLGLNKTTLERQIAQHLAQRKFSCSHYYLLCPYLSLLLILLKSLGLMLRLLVILLMSVSSSLIWGIQIIHSHIQLLKTLLGWFHSYACKPSVVIP